MTTVIIEIPDNKSSVLTAITDITKNAGLEVFVQTDDDEGLSQSEFESLKKGLEEVVAIKKGLVKAIPASQLWND